MEPQSTSNTAVIAAIVAATIAFIANIITTVITFVIAKLNSNKDIKLQNERLLDDRNKSEVALLRSKLEEVHIILSKIELENSQTLSFFHSTSGITRDQYRERYLENCERVHKAVCTTDLYFDEMSSAIRNIYNEMNSFWGNQEALLMINKATNRLGWDNAFGEVIAASKTISAKAQEVQIKIVSVSKILNDRLKT